jgi:hypothetical protein
MITKPTHKGLLAAAVFCSVVSAGCMTRRPAEIDLISPLVSSHHCHVIGLNAEYSLLVLDDGHDPSWFLFHRVGFLVRLRNPPYTGHRSSDFIVSQDGIHLAYVYYQEGHPVLSIVLVSELLDDIGAAPVVEDKFFIDIATKEVTPKCQALKDPIEYYGEYILTPPFRGAELDLFNVMCTLAGKNSDGRVLTYLQRGLEIEAYSEEHEFIRELITIASSRI